MEWVEEIVGVAQQVARGNIQQTSGAHAALGANSDCQTIRDCYSFFQISFVCVPITLNFHVLAHSPLPCYSTRNCNPGTCAVHVVCTAHVHNKIFTVNTCTRQYKIFRLARRPARVEQMSEHFQTHFNWKSTILQISMFQQPHIHHNEVQIHNNHSLLNQVYLGQ